MKCILLLFLSHLWSYHCRRAALGSRRLLMLLNKGWWGLFLPFSGPQDLEWWLTHSKFGGQKKSHPVSKIPYFGHWKSDSCICVINQPWLVNKVLLLIFHWNRKWQPTPVILPGESHGQRNLLGYSPWCCKESDTTERRSHNKAFVGNKRQWVLQAIAVWCPKQV